MYVRQEVYKMFELFVLDSCPYSIKVMNFMKENNIKYKKRVVSEPENYDLLQKLGGKSQVPFLYDEEKGLKMYESDDIIEYLKNEMQE